MCSIVDDGHRMAGSASHCQACLPDIIEVMYGATVALVALPVTLSLPYMPQALTQRFL